MKIALYAHGGSKNHGCEALVRSAIGSIGHQHEYILLSENPEEDEYYALDKLAMITEATDRLPSGFGDILYRIKAKINGADETYNNYIYRSVADKVADCDVAIAIGGDNYCYKGYLERFGAMNRRIRSAGVPTILLGCSIEPSVMTPALLNDLKGYVLITVRESMTYEALRRHGLKNLILCPDTAFTLPMADVNLDCRLAHKNTVGINLSPMIMAHEAMSGITMQNYDELIRYILENTDMNVALIPHVVWNHNDDRLPMRSLYEKFQHTNRIFLQDDCNAMQLKNVISQCRFMIAARTHASIAAYSTCVPTLVVGYSIKADGIANDLFGADKNYVIPVESLRNHNDLENAFVWLMEHENKILTHYENMMAQYIGRVKELASAIQMSIA